MTEWCVDCGCPGHPIREGLSRLRVNLVKLGRGMGLLPQPKPLDRKFMMQKIDETSATLERLFKITNEAWDEKIASAEAPLNEQTYNWKKLHAPITYTDKKLR